MGGSKLSMADNKLNGKPCSLLQLGFDSLDFLKKKRWQYSSGPVTR
jgi:hypothetical protein